MSTATESKDTSPRTDSDNLHQVGRQTSTSQSASSRATTVLAPIPASSIASNSQKCVENYKTLCNALKDVPVQDSARRGYNGIQCLIAMLDAQAKFNAWAVNIAALHAEHLQSSLDFRLTDAADIRLRILEILRDLQESLNAASSIVLGSSPNEIWTIKPLDEHGESTVFENSLETSEIEQLLLAMKNANSSLMKLSMIIRNSPRRDDYLKAASRYDFDSIYDIGHVKEKHGSAQGASDWLLERLGKAITRRRQYLKYREDHHEKLSRDWEDLSRSKESKEDEQPEKSIALTKATTFIEKSLTDNHDSSEVAGSLGSKTSYEETHIGKDSADKLTVPQRPDMAFEGIPFEYGEPFRCPYCYTEQKVKNRMEWKKHVFCDLKPYVCTFKKCDLRMFCSRHEWFAHELQVHRREWVCGYCHHQPFSTAESFSTHLVSRHPTILKLSQLEAIVLQSEEPIDKIPATACKLCNQWEVEVRTKNKGLEKSSLDEKGTESYGPLSKFRKHLGRHMEQLALFALPINRCKEDEDLSSEGAEEELSDHAENDVTRAGYSGLDAMTKEESSLSDRNGDGDVRSRQPEADMAKAPAKEPFIQSEQPEGKVAEAPAMKPYVRQNNTARTPSRMSHFFLNGQGIDREVITTDICRYIGNDALVKPGTHRDQKSGENVEGYYITSYQPPTSAHLADLRADSLKWQEERQRDPARAQGGYASSTIRRETYGDYSYENQQPGAGYRTEAYAGGPPGMAPPGAYREGLYGPSRQNISTNHPPAPLARQMGFLAGVNSSRDQMELSLTQTNFQANFTYPSQALPAGFAPGHGRGSQFTLQPSQPISAEYGGQQVSMNYDPSCPRDSGVPQEAYYDIDDELMDYDYDLEPPQNQASFPFQPRRERERDLREKGEDSRERRRRRRS